MSSNLLARLADLLPPHCLLCGQRASANLCTGCHRDLPWVRDACLQCGLPLAANAGDYCGHCLRHPPAFDACHAALVYRPPVSQLVHQFKYQRSLAAGRTLADCLGQSLAAGSRSVNGNEVLLSPVPLHWRRQCRRTFNQAAYLARQVANQFDLPMEQCVQRRAPTPRQQSLSRKQRQHNLREAFWADADAVAGRHLILVDDVVTTGATAETLARTLKEAGARRVDCWCVARTPEFG